MPVPSPIQSPAIQRGADLLTELFKSTVRPYIEKIAQIETELVGLQKAELQAQEKTTKIQSAFQVKLTEVQTEAFNATKLANRYEKSIAQLSTVCGLAPLSDGHPVHFNEETGTLLHEILMEARNFRAALQALTNTNQCVDTLPTSIPEPSSVLSALNVFLNQLQSTNAAWQVEFKEMKHTNVVLEDRLHSLSKACKDSEAETSHLRITNTASEARCQELNKANTALEERLKSLYKEYEDSLAEWKTKNEVLLKEREEQNARLKTAEEEVESHRHSVSILRSDLSDVTAARNALHQERDGLTLKCTMLRNDLTSARSMREELQEELRQEQKQREALSMQCASLTDSATSLEEQMARVKNDTACSTAALEARLKELRESEIILNQRIKTLSEEHRTAMDSSQSLVDDLLHTLVSQGASITIPSSTPPTVGAPSSSPSSSLVRPSQICPSGNSNMIGGSSARPVVRAVPVPGTSNTALSFSTPTSASPYNVSRVEQPTTAQNPNSPRSGQGQSNANSIATQATHLDAAVVPHQVAKRTAQPFNPPSPRPRASLVSSRLAISSSHLQPGSPSLKRAATESNETSMKRARTSPSASLSSSSSQRKPSQ